MKNTTWLTTFWNFHISVAFAEVITRKMGGEKLKFQFTRIRKAIIIVIE